MEEVVARGGGRPVPAPPATVDGPRVVAAAQLLADALGSPVEAPSGVFWQGPVDGEPILTSGVEWLTFDPRPVRDGGDRVNLGGVRLGVFGDQEFSEPIDGLPEQYRDRTDVFVVDARALGTTGRVRRRDASGRVWFDTWTPQRYVDRILASEQWREHLKTARAGSFEPTVVFLQNYAAGRPRVWDAASGEWVADASRVSLGEQIAYLLGQKVEAPITLLAPNGSVDRDPDTGVLGGPELGQLDKTGPVGDASVTPPSGIVAAATTAAWQVFRTAQQAAAQLPIVKTPPSMQASASASASSALLENDEITEIPEPSSASTERRATLLVPKGFVGAVIDQFANVKRPPRTVRFGDLPARPGRPAFADVSIDGASGPTYAQLAAGLHDTRTDDGRANMERAAEAVQSLNGDWVKIDRLWRMCLYVTGSDLRRKWPHLFLADGGGSAVTRFDEHTTAIGQALAGAEARANPQQANIKLTIAAAPGQRRRGDFGHAWIEVELPAGDFIKIGFRAFSTSGRVWVAPLPGEITAADTESSGYPNPVRHSQWITLAQLDALHRYAVARIQKPYFLYRYNCANMASELFHAATGQRLGVGRFPGPRTLARNLIRADIRAAYRNMNVARRSALAGRSGSGQARLDKPDTSGSGTGPPGTGPDGLIKSDTPDVASAATDVLQPNQPRDTTTQDSGERLDDGGVGASVPSVVVYQALVPPLSTLASSGIDATAARLLIGGGEISAEQLDASWAAFRTSWDKVINPRLALIGFQAAITTGAGLYQVVRALQSAVEQVHDRITSLQSQPSPPHVVQAVVEAYANLILSYDLAAKEVLDFIATKVPDANLAAALPPTAKAFGSLPANAQPAVDEMVPDQSTPGVTSQSLAPTPVVEQGALGSGSGVGLNQTGVVMTVVGGVRHLWVGIEPDDAFAEGLSKQGKVRAGVLVVHGHGADGGVAASPVQKQQMREQIAAARAQRVVSEVLLLVCGQAEAQGFADTHEIATWASKDAVFVNALDGSVFIGQATVGPDKALRVPAGSVPGRVDKFVPKGHGPVAEPGPAPLSLLRLPQGGVVAGKWEPRGGGELTFDSSPSSALLEDDGTGTAMTPAIGQKTSSGQHESGTLTVQSTVSSGTHSAPEPSSSAQVGSGTAAEQQVVGPLLNGGGVSGQATGGGGALLLPRRKVRKIWRLVGRSGEQVGVRWPSADTGVAWLLLNRALDDSQLRFDDLGVWLRSRKPDTVPAGHFLYRVRLPRKAAVKLAGPAGEDLFLPRQAEASTLVEKVYPRGGVVAGRMGHADVLVNQALSGFGRPQPDAAAELRVITDVGKFNPMQLLPAVGAMVWPDARPQDEWVGSDRPNWPNDALLAVGPGKSKRSFDEGLLPSELGGPVVGDGSVKWREASRLATGDLEADGLAAGTMLYVGFWPGGLDAGGMGVAGGGVLAPYGVGGRFVAGGFPIRKVVGTTVTLDPWRMNPHFGGAMLLGAAPPSTEGIVAQLTNAGYRVVWSNTAAPVDVHTAGDNFGERTDEFMRFYAPTAYMSLSTLGGSDAKQQQATLQTLVNSVTQRLDIKPFRAVIDKDLMGVGQYDRTNGRLKLNPRLVGADTFEPSLVAVHEMRHGHQGRSSRKSVKMKRRGEPVPPQQKHLKDIANELTPLSFLLRTGWYMLAGWRHRRAYPEATGHEAKRLQMRMWKERKRVHPAMQQYYRQPDEADAFALGEQLRKWWPVKSPAGWRGTVTGRARAPYRLVIEPSRLQLFRVGTVPTRPDTWRPPAHPFMPRLEVYLDPYDSADRAELAEVLESVDFQSIAAARPVIVEFVGRRFTAAQAQELADWVEGVRGGFGAVSVPLALLSGERVVPSPRVRTLGRDSFQVPGMLADQALFFPSRLDPPAGPAVSHLPAAGEFAGQAVVAVAEGVRWVAEELPGGVLWVHPDPLPQGVTQPVLDDAAESTSTAAGRRVVIDVKDDVPEVPTEVWDRVRDMFVHMAPGLTVDVYLHGTVGGVAVPPRMTVGPADVRTVSVPAHARDVDVVVTEDTEYTGATGEVEDGPPALEPGQVQTTVADPPEDASPTVSKQVEVRLPQRAANSVVAAWQLRLAYRAVVLAAEQATAATGGGSVAIPLLGLDSGWTVQESRQAAHDVLDSIETTLRTIEISDGSSTAAVEDGEDDSSQKSIDSPLKDPKPSVTAGAGVGGSPQAPTVMTVQGGLGESGGVPPGGVVSGGVGFEPQVVSTEVGGVRPTTGLGSSSIDTTVLSRESANIPGISHTSPAGTKTEPTSGLTSADVQAAAHTDAPAAAAAGDFGGSLVDKSLSAVWALPTFAGLLPLVGARVFEVAMDRWQPLANSFVLVPGVGGGPGRVVRRPGESGVRTLVGYRLAVAEGVWRFTVPVFLKGEVGVDEFDLAYVREAARRGVQHYVNGAPFGLPGVDARLEVEVDFVDDAARGHVVAVGSGGEMHQSRWLVGAKPEVLAHEVVHWLGGVHRVHRPDALRRRGRPVVEKEHREGWDAVGTKDWDKGKAFLSANVLQQIVTTATTHTGVASLSPGLQDVAGYGQAKAGILEGNADVPPEAGGGEYELLTTLVEFPPGVDPLNVEYLVKSDRFKLVWDTRPGGLLVEVVTEPMNMLDGETRWHPPVDVFTGVHNAIERLLTVPLGKGVPLVELFPRRAGFEVHPRAIGAMIKHSPNSSFPGLVHVQHTVGVPLGGMYPFLQFIAAQIPPDEVSWRAQRALPYLQEGLAFGAEFAEQFAQDEEVDQVCRGWRRRWPGI